jgi:PhnB protein
MPVVLNPYLTFPGTARDAMTFYQSVLGGELTISTFGEYGAEGADADGVMHANLETPSGLVLMASDTGPGMGEGYTPGTHMSVSISGDDEAIRDYWKGLSEGATVTMPMEKQMWGDEFGMLTDRFGIPWMINLGTGAAEPPAQAASSQG